MHNSPARNGILAPKLCFSWCFHARPLEFQTRSVPLGGFYFSFCLLSYHYNHTLAQHVEFLVNSTLRALCGCHTRSPARLSFAFPCVTP